MFFQIVLGGFAGDHFKMLVEAGEIIETAFETQLLDADAVVDEQLAGVPDAYLRHELRIGFARPGFEITAKGVGYQPRDGCHFFQIDLF